MLIPNCRDDINYNENYLTEHDKRFLKGYDYAIGVIKNFLENLDSNIEISNKVDLELLVDIKDEGLTTLECNRDELITSMIDNMDEDVFETNKESYLKEHPDNKFYDTRSFSEVAKRSGENNE